MKINHYWPPENIRKWIFLHWRRQYLRQNEPGPDPLLHKVKCVYFEGLCWSRSQPGWFWWIYYHNMWRYTHWWYVNKRVYHWNSYQDFSAWRKLMVFAFFCRILSSIPGMPQFECPWTPTWNTCLKKYFTGSFNQKPGRNQKLIVKHSISYKHGLDEISISSTIKAILQLILLIAVMSKPN